MKMIMEKWWNTDRGNPEYLEKNLSQCNLVHNKPHLDWRNGIGTSVVKGRAPTA